MWCYVLCSCPGFAQSEEAAPIERMLDAYYECDQEAVERVTKSPLFKFMENDVSYSRFIYVQLLVTHQQNP